MDIVLGGRRCEQDAVVEEELPLYISVSKHTSIQAMRLYSSTSLQLVRKPKGMYGAQRTSVRSDCSFTCLPLDVSKIWSSLGMFVAFAIHVRKASSEVTTGSGHWMHSPAGIVNICSDMRAGSPFPRDSQARKGRVLQFVFQARSKKERKKGEVVVEGCTTIG
jgi:hypothetical protein